jgi:hypothetical protein
MVLPYFLYLYAVLHRMCKCCHFSITFGFFFGFVSIVFIPSFIQKSSIEDQIQRIVSSLFPLSIRRS